MTAVGMRGAAAEQRPGNEGHDMVSAVNGVRDLKPQPKVLLACSGIGHVARGYERITEELAQALAPIAAVTLARGGGRWFVAPGIRLPCVQRFGPAARYLGLRGGKAYLTEQRTFAPALYALARLGRFDIVHLHDPGLMNAIWHARRMLGGNFSLVFTNGGGMSPEHLKRPDLIQSVTPLDADRLQEAGFSRDTVAMVPHGTRPSMFSAGLTSDTDLPSRFIGVGSLNDSMKGFATAVRAVACVPGASLRLLGQRDEETPALEAFGQSLLGARFATATLPAEAVPAALAMADVFLLPTHGEGFCLAVLEAMAAGLPCIVSDIPVLRWLVADGALLVSRERPDDWKAAILSLSAQRRRELGERARRRAADFSWERVGPLHLAMYEQALHNRARVRRTNSN